MRLDDLKQMNPPIPPAMEEALVHHVRGLKEEPMKRRMPLALALSLILVLVLGTVAAATYVYSVRPWVPDNKLDQITVISDRHENQWLTVSINDAYSDGTRMNLALNLRHREGADPVYIFPVLTAHSGGKDYFADVEMGFELIDGVWLPERWDNHAGPGNYPLEVVLLKRVGESLEEVAQVDYPIEWRLRFHVLRLAEGWQMEHLQEVPSTNEEVAPIVERAYREKTVLLTYDDSVVEFTAFRPLPEGLSAEEWLLRPTWQQLLDTGAFEEVDTFERVFITP